MSKIVDELRAVSWINTHVAGNVSTTYAQPFTYEQTLRALKVCSDAATRLEEAERLLALCEKKIEAYKKQSRNEYPGGPLLNTFMPTLRRFLEAFK